MFAASQPSLRAVGSEGPSQRWGRRRGSGCGGHGHGHGVTLGSSAAAHYSEPCSDSCWSSQPVQVFPAKGTAFSLRSVLVATPILEQEGPLCWVHLSEYVPVLTLGASPIYPARSHLWKDGVHGRGSRTLGAVSCPQQAGNEGLWLSRRGKWSSGFTSSLYFTSSLATSSTDLRVSGSRNLVPFSPGPPQACAAWGSSGLSEGGSE